MKAKIFLFLLIGLLTTASFAQNDKAEIKKTAEAFFNLIQQKKYDKMLDYFYPKIFEEFPKEELLKNMKEIQTDSAFTFSIENSRIENISEIVEVKGIKYALLTYSYKMSLVFTTQKNATKEEKELFNQIIMQGISQQEHGIDNVKYDEKSGKIIIVDTDQKFAINDPQYKGWKFLDITPDKESLKKYIPEEVIKELY